MEPKRKSSLDVIIPILCIIAALYLSLHLAISYDNLLLRHDKFNFINYFADVGDRLENHLSEISITKSSPKFAGVSLGACLIIWIYFATTKKKLISRKEYGTAEWADKRVLKKMLARNVLKDEIESVKKNRKIKAKKRKIMIEALKIKFRSSKMLEMILTATERICIYNRKLNNNTLIIGGSGSGKTRGYVMPNILQAHSSFIVTDPKGEILEKSGYFLELNHYKIRVLNLDEKSLSDGYNPFHYIHRERDGWEERVLSLIETIIINTDGDGNKGGGSDPFWEKAEKLFLQAIFFAVTEAFPPEQSNMNTVSELIRWLKIAEDEDTYDSDLDLFFMCFEKRYGSDHIGVQQFKEFREKASGKTAKSIVISAVARLAPFKVQEVRRIFSYDNMKLEMVGEEKTAIFVIVPPVDKTYNFIAGMLFTQLFQELNYCALNVHKHDGQCLPVPCRFILDEFANTCKIPNFTMILAYARSLGIGITTILQSLDQIKTMYKDEWPVIVDNSSTLLYLGRVTHMETLKYLSELLGKGTYDKQSSSRTRGRQGSSSLSSDRIGRELLDPSEIRKIPDDKCLLFVSGKNPFYSKKYEYVKHENYEYTSDGNKDYKYYYNPEPPPNLTVINNSSPYTPPLISEDQIEMETNQEYVAKYVADNVLNMEVDRDELLVVEDGEDEVAALWDLMEESEDKENEDNNALLMDIIQFQTSPESIACESISFINDEINEPGCIDFDNYEVDDGEPSVVEDYDFEEAGVMDEINVIYAEALSLSKDMNLSGFEEQLNNIDFDALVLIEV